MYANNSHSYTRLLLALGIVNKPTACDLLLQSILERTDLVCLLLEGKLGAHLTRMGNKGGMLFLYNGPIVNLKQLGASVARFMGALLQ